MRRPQFSLKSLLGLLITVCLGLGGWRLHRYRQFIEVGPARVAQSVRVKCRFCIDDGPVIQTFFALAEAPEVNGFQYRWDSGAVARRVGPGIYDFEVKLGHPRTPGVHRLRVWPHVPGGLGTPLETTFTVAP